MKRHNPYRRDDCLSLILVAISLAAMLIILAVASRSQAIAPIRGENGKLIVAQAAERKGPFMPLTDEEYALICNVIDLEAGGESEQLQRAVCECILNRITCGHWGSTVSDVVWATDDRGIYQFEVMYWIERAQPSELTKRVVREVFRDGPTIPARVMFFRKDYYHSTSWARAEFSIGVVYFSSSKWLEV